MKKFLLLCMVSCLLFSLSGHNNQHYGDNEKKAVISSQEKGGPGFKAYMNLLDQTIKKIKNCKNCDDLEKVMEYFLDKVVKISDQYSDDDLTNAEEETLEQRLEEMESLLNSQMLKLCGKSLFDETEVDVVIEEEVVEEVAPEPAEEVAVKPVDLFQNNVKGSPAYLEVMELMDDFEKQLNKCTSCERLTVLTNRFSEDCKAIKKKYGEDVDITEWEEDRIDDRFDEIGELLSRKHKQLCDD